MTNNTLHRPRRTRIQAKAPRRLCHRRCRTTWSIRGTLHHHHRTTKSINKGMYTTDSTHIHLHLLIERDVQIAFFHTIVHCSELGTGTRRKKRLHTINMQPLSPQHQTSRRLKLCQASSVYTLKSAGQCLLHHMAGPPSPRLT